MSKAFPVKPILRAERRSGAEIANMISPELRGVAVQAEQGDEGRHRGKAEKTLQINFRATAGFARLIAIEAEKVGGMRKWFARLAQQAGHDVPEADLNPPSTRREW